MAKTKQAPRPNHKQMPKWASITLIATLAALTVAVVVFALMQTRGGVEHAGEVPSASQPQPQPVEPEPKPEGQPTPEPAYVAPALQRLLALSEDSTHILRAQAGTCEAQSGSVEVSFDGGLNWQPSSLVNSGGVALLQLDMSTPEVDRFVGLTAECEPMAARSFVGGTDWEPEQQLEGSWYLDLADRATVHTPVGPQALPCEAVSLASHAARAIALCSDGSVTSTEDAGASWSAPTAVPNTVAVGVAPEAFITVSGGEPDCQGVRARTFDGSVLNEPGACVEGPNGSDGQIATAGNTSGWYLWVGDDYLYSSDQGATWA